MENQDTTKNLNSKNQAKIGREDQNAISQHEDLKNLNSEIPETIPSEAPINSTQQASTSEAPANATFQSPANEAPINSTSKTPTADILVINYGEYGPDETIYQSELYQADLSTNSLNSHNLGPENLHSTSSDSSKSDPMNPNSKDQKPNGSRLFAKKSHSPKTSENPDDLEEIEFERFLRIFKERTKSAAQKTKIAAHNLHQNSLIRFTKWVDPKIAPYRDKTLVKSAAKKAKTKSSSSESPVSINEQKALTVPNQKDLIKPDQGDFVLPSSSESSTIDSENSHSHIACGDTSSKVKNEELTDTKEPATNYELQESTPYVPKTTAEFLNLMRRTPKTVLTNRERHVIATIMNFKNVKVSEIMQPADNITYVNYEEVLGPLTLDRLYRAGYDHFPVVDNRHKIIGLIHTAALNSLEIKETSKAGDLLDPKVYYVREDYTLNQALAAFLRTNCYFFLVIDRFEKIVGMLTYQILVNYLLGETPEDDFYRDEDRLAVAKRKM